MTVTATDFVQSSRPNFIPNFGGTGVSGSGPVINTPVLSGPGDNPHSSLPRFSDYLPKNLCSGKGPIPKERLRAFYANQVAALEAGKLGAFCTKISEAWNRCSRDLSAAFLEFQGRGAAIRGAVFTYLGSIWEEMGCSSNTERAACVFGDDTVDEIVNSGYEEDTSLPVHSSHSYEDFRHVNAFPSNNIAQAQSLLVPTPRYSYEDFRHVNAFPSNNIAQAQSLPVPTPRYSYEDFRHMNDFLPSNN